MTAPDRIAQTLMKTLAKRGRPHMTTPYGRSDGGGARLRRRPARRAPGSNHRRAVEIYDTVRLTTRSSLKAYAIVTLASHEKAWVMSAMRSSGCSIPIDMRIKAGVIPISRRDSSVSPECTVVAGWQIKDSVPPRLTASLNI
jgi:hypothetical protein